MIIEQILGKMQSMDTAGKSLHVVELTDTEMEKGHQRTKTKDGMDIAISLPEGVQMEHDDVLFFSETDVIVVKAAMQEVFVLMPVSTREWGKVCYNIGNMHQKAYITQTEVVVPYDYVLEGVIKSLEVPFVIEKRRISGEKANISAKIHKGGHHHHH